MRPGNYVFYDRTQVGLGATPLEDCAMSRDRDGRQPARSPRASIFDAGSKTLTSDAARGFGATTGHGLVFPDLETDTPTGSIAIERLSEEHAVARVLPDCPLKPGDRVRILPNHACVVTNLANELVLADGMTVVDRIPVEARGRTTDSRSQKSEVTAERANRTVARASVRVLTFDFSLLTYDCVIVPPWPRPLCPAKRSAWSRRADSSA